MGAAPRPPNELSRLAALHRLDILDTPPDPAFDRITDVAKRVCGCPIALVSLVDDERQWFKSSIGLEAAQTPREVAFCGYTILEAQILEVPDATRDPRFADNPLVTGEPWIRFYAGAPIEVAPGVRVGTLCVIDREVRTLSEDQREVLRSLAATIVDLLESHRRAVGLASCVRSLEEETREAHGVGAALEREVSQPLARLGAALQDASASDGALVLAQDISARVHATAARLSRLLRMPAVSAGQLQRIDMRSMVERAAGSVAARHPDGTLHVDVDAGEFTTHEDSLQAVFEHLLDNAFRHGASTATVCGGLDDGWWCASVSDDGPGVDPERHREAFEPCRRLQDDTDTKGMGLPVSRRLIRMLGGRLWIDSDQIGGTVVRFEIPVAD